jgi:soluble P-type ATPase
VGLAGVRGDELVPVRTRRTRGPCKRRVRRHALQVRHDPRERAREHRADPERRLHSVDLNPRSADTFGTAAQIAGHVNASFRKVRDGAGKLQHVRQLGAERCVAIGNGTNDVLMLDECSLGIVVLGPEGTSGAALRVADVICRSIEEALDLLLSPQALVATLRA